MNLRNRSLLTLQTYSREEILYLLELARQLKIKKRQGEYNPQLRGKNIVLIFDKPSTRTRCAFEVAAADEGAFTTFLSNSQMGKKESIQDTAQVLARYYDAICYRGDSQQLVQDLAHYSQIPVYNALTDEDHPTQVLADFMTATEHLDKPLAEMKLVYVGDGRNNVARSLMIGCAKVGMRCTVASPKTLQVQPEFIDTLHSDLINTVEDPFEAVNQADIIYTDVWFSMGEEAQMADRIAILEPYRVTPQLLEATNNPDVIFQHCLPAFHDTHTEIGQRVLATHALAEMEVSDEVFQGKHSVVFDQAENRMHTIKALLVATLA